MSRFSKKIVRQIEIYIYVNTVPLFVSETEHSDEDNDNIDRDPNFCLEITKEIKTITLFKALAKVHFLRWIKKTFVNVLARIFVRCVINECLCIIQLATVTTRFVTMLSAIIVQ